MKVKVENLYRIELEQEAAECLLALIYCNLCSTEDSPLDSLSVRLKNALNLDDDGVTALVECYQKFV